MTNVILTIYILEDRYLFVRDIPSSHWSRNYRCSNSNN